MCSCGRPRDLGTLGGIHSHAYDINDRGDVVGEAQTASGVGHATLWPAGGGPPRDLGTVGAEYPTSEALAISERGDVVGASSQGNSVRATLWPAGGGPSRDLGTLGGPQATAFDINNRGDVVGWSQAADGSQRATVWPANGGPPRELPLLPGVSPASRALAINDLGDVVGYAGSPSPRAILWPADGGPPRDLGPATGSDGRARGINNFGYVVGSARVPGGRAIRWSVATSATRDPRTVVRIYKDHDAWRVNADGGRDEATLTAMGKTKGTDFFVHAMSSLASGIPAGTRVVVITANSAGARATSAAQRSDAAQQALVAFLETGGTLLLDLADNEDADGYRAPGATGTPSFTVPTNCVDVTLASATRGTDGVAATADDHRFVRGPDGLTGTDDDVDDETIDLTHGASEFADRSRPSYVPKGCSAVHGNLQDGITLPGDARVLATAVWPDGPRPVLAEYCHAGGRVVVNTLTLGYFAHKPREGGYPIDLLRTSFVQRSLFAYALSTEAGCNGSPDAEAPVLAVPSNISLSATMAVGAIVYFVVSSRDNVGVASLSCTRGQYDGTPTRLAPHYRVKSGDWFPIGTHTVSCTAADAAANSVSKGFTVSVADAESQLLKLAVDVENATTKPYETYLRGIVDKVLVDARNPQTLLDACVGLDGFMAEVNGNTGTRIPGDRAVRLIAAGRRIKSVLDCPGQLAGVVSDSATDLGIAGARVTITGGPDEGFSKIATTDGSGHYVIDALRPGTYTVTPAADFFWPIAHPSCRTYACRSSGEQVVEIHGTNVELNIPMAPAMYVEGYVTNAANGRGIYPATVTLTGGPIPGFRRSTPTWGGGQYIFYGLSAGTYTMTVSAPPEFFAAPERVVHVDRGLSDVNFRLDLGKGEIYVLPDERRSEYASKRLSMQDNASIQLKFGWRETHPWLPTPIVWLPMEWSSSDPLETKATVSAAGLVTVKEGNDDIKAANEVVVATVDPRRADTVRINSFSFDHVPRTLTLIWRPVAGAVKYELPIEYCHGTYRNPASDGSGLLPAECTKWTRQENRVVTGTWYTFDFSFQRAGRWRVRALDAAGAVLSVSENVYFNFVR